MRCLNFIAILIMLISCKEKKENYIESNLYNAVLNYQKEYPIPANNPKKYIYVYKIYFSKVENDTFIEIYRSSGGINKFDKNFGVYFDEILEPTFIYDKNNLGQKFILNKPHNESKQKYYWINKGNTPENYPPIYSYLVKEKNLVLVKKDTVWKHWD